MVAPGIAEALFATAIGLFAAIPAVIAYNRFSHGVNRIEASLQPLRRRLPHDAVAPAGRGALTMAMQPPSRAAGGRRAPMAEINVTPLVDVMLVLLIIFMVTAPLLTAGVPVNLPDSRAKPLDQEQKPVEVSLDDEGRMFVDKEEVERGGAAGAAGARSRALPTSRRRSSCAPTARSITAA